MARSSGAPPQSVYRQTDEPLHLWPDRAAVASRLAGRLPLRNAAVVTVISAYLFLGSAIFALSLKPLPALLVVAGCVGAVWLIAQPKAASRGPILDAPIQGKHLALCIGLAGAILLLGGETHVFFAAPDWRIRDAVLADLVQHGMATIYHVGDSDYILRAPLGMYIVPALVGRMFGLAVAHIALLAQNALFLGSIFYLLQSLGRGWRHLLIVVLFAGLVIVPDLMRLVITQKPFHLTTVIDAWVPFWQYSSSILQFFWVPNHALPGWWLATLLLLSRRSTIDEPTLGLTVAGLILWSPLAIAPAVIWLLYRAMVAWRAVFRSPRLWAGIALSACFVPVFVYLVQGSATIAHGNVADIPDATFWYVFFVLVQLPALFFSLLFWRHVPKELRALLVVNGLCLLFLPLFNFGPSNDLVRRGSITALTIVAFVFGAVVLDLIAKRKAGAVVGLTLILATLPSAAGEILRAVMLPPSPISSCSLMEASFEFGDTRLPTNYVVAVDRVPHWLFATEGTPIQADRTRVCTPQKPTWDTGSARH